MTMTAMHWAYDSALTQTHEERLVSSVADDMLGKFGFTADYDFRPLIRSGPIVRKGLAIQANPQISRDWFERYADYRAQNLLTVAPKTPSRAH